MPLRFFGRSFWRSLLLLSLCAGAAPAWSQQGEATELRFGEMYRRPVGPRGLEPSEKLKALDGRAVRMVGYMTATELPMPGRLILSPLPASLGDEDEALADDLPAQVVYVHLTGAPAQNVLPQLPGLLRLQGVLSVGPHEESDGHVASVRLTLGAADSTRLMAAAAAHDEPNPKQTPGTP